jgi:hypothetical protein
MLYSDGPRQCIDRNASPQQASKDPKKLYKSFVTAWQPPARALVHPGESDEVPRDIPFRSSFVCERLSKKSFWQEIYSFEIHRLLAVAVWRDALDVIVFGPRGPSANQRSDATQ